MQASKRSFLEGGDRYEPRKTFLLADLQEIVIGPSVFLVFQPSNEIDIYGHEITEVFEAYLRSYLRSNLNIYLRRYLRTKV